VLCNGNRWKLIARRDLELLDIPWKRKFLKVFRDLRAGKAVNLLGEEVEWPRNDNLTDLGVGEFIGNSMPHVRCCGCGAVFWEGMGKASVPYDAAYIKNAFPELKNLKDDVVM